MYYKMIPYAVGVQLMVAAAARFASKDDFVGAGIALVAAFVASVTAVKAHSIELRSDPFEGFVDG